MPIYFLLLLFIGTNSQENEPKTLCDMCACSEISNFEKTDFVLNIQCSEFDRIDNVADLDKIVWPKNSNGLKITASFEGLGLSTLGKLPPNNLVGSLRFSNNVIKTYWPDPFSNIPNLKILSFAQNDLVEIKPDLFTNIEKLEELDLSYNKITDFNPMDFKTLRSVKKFNLQSNSIKTIPIEALQPMVALEELDLSKNAISDLFLQYKQSSLPSLKILNLSSNRIRSVLRDSFPETNSIELLDISNNMIENVEVEAFLACTSLRELNLGQNKIMFTFELPMSLQVATFKINSLHHWPRFPSGIKHIDLSYNKLSEIYDENVVDFNSLENLNIAGNQIETLQIRLSLPSLLTFDISYNNLKEIPSTINSQIFPVLHELRLDGNPLESIYFKNIIALESLSMNELNNVESVEDKAFCNVVPRAAEGNEDDNVDCLSLYLSDCPSLKEIKETAFECTNVCMLDISRNNLTHISRDLLNWTTLSEVNLQFNPWDCSCEMQWLLDDLLPQMVSKNSRLLSEFRCHSPRGFEGLRLIHFFNWTEKVMCDDTYLKNGPRQNYSLEPSTLDSKVTSLTLILVGTIIVGLFIIIGLVVYLIRNRKQYKVRKAALTRKRQRAEDARNSNGTHHEQFSALNRT